MNGEETMTILIIDDEEQMRRLLRITLEASDYRVAEAATGKAGITEDRKSVV